MSVLINGLLLFCIAFFIHLSVWKIHLPKNHTKILLVIFFAVLLGGFSLLYNFNKFNIFEYLQISLLFISMALAYITTYSGIEVQSPSLRIVLEIKNSGKLGLDREALDRNFNNDVLVALRMNDLVKDKMIYQDGDKFKLTPKGILLVRLLIFYRKLLNAGMGG
jgi:predicted transcriptional regulator